MRRTPMHPRRTTPTTPNILDTSYNSKAEVEILWPIDGERQLLELAREAEWNLVVLIVDPLAVASSLDFQQEFEKC